MSSLFGYKSCFLGGGIAGHLVNLCFYLQIKLFCMHPVKMMMESKLEVHKDKTLREATEMAYKVGWIIVFVFNFVQQPLQCNTFYQLNKGYLSNQKY